MKIICICWNNMHHDALSLSPMENDFFFVEKQNFENTIIQLIIKILISDSQKNLSSFRKIANHQINKVSESFKNYQSRKKSLLSAPLTIVWTFSFSFYLSPTWKHTIFEALLNYILYNLSWVRIFFWLNWLA